MIKILTGNGNKPFYLTHHSGDQWLDQAGHRWLQSNGRFTSSKHGSHDSWVPCRSVKDGEGLSNDAGHKLKGGEDEI